MLEGTYYKKWSTALDRDMEFKVYGNGGVPVLALPARGGRFYDWENNGMPGAVAQLIGAGKVQLFCADAIDAEGLLDGGAAPRRRAEKQEAYFNYLTRELAVEIRALNSTEPDAEPQKIWCVGVDTGAYQAVNCYLRRPGIFAGAICLSGLYDTARFMGDASDDLVLRNSPLAYLRADGVVDKEAVADASAIVLCAGQGPYENEALADTQLLADALNEQGIAVQPEIWGNDVSHDWYWWGKEFGLFAHRLFDC